MLETLRCPSCSTRYGLRATRVHPGIRRAQCFRCTTVFDIEAAVAHLLAPPAGPPPEFDPEPEPVDLPPSLTLGDLDGAEEEILDKTLIHLAAPPAEVGVEAEDSPYASSGSGYASAKDAIARLMGEPLPPKPQQRGLTHPGGMDVEATLSALEDTLGGQRVFETKPEPEPEPEPEAALPPPAPMTTASTMRLTLSEIQAALASATPAVPSAGAPGAATIPPGFVLPTRIETASPLEQRLPTPPLSAPQDPNLLKVQLDQEIYNNVTIEQMGAWVEEGRVHEFDMVARQFSEHWIEANKVPALRPIFEQRRRRQGGGQEELPIPPAEILPPKRGLFGGLFGRS